jgi:TFIIF-interacting CTD phosphatase-like protein
MKFPNDIKLIIFHIHRYWINICIIKNMRTSHSEAKQNFKFTSRGASTGYPKRQPNQFANIITQVDENGYHKNTKHQTLADNAYDRIHSPLPNRKKFIDNFLIQEQQGHKIGRKTLILDLDETLVHSAFEPFDCPADIELKVIIIFYKDRNRRPNH